MSGDYSRDAVLRSVVRWTAYRKYCLLTAVNSGTITCDEAMAAHNIGAEEWAEWSARLENTPEALKALNTQKLRSYR